MKRTTLLFVTAGLLIAAALALLVGPFASDSPDGLEKVAADEGFDHTEVDHRLGGSPLADYGIDGVASERTGTALSGVAGVLVTFGVALGTFAVIQVLSARSSGRSADGDARGGGSGADMPGSAP